MRVPRSVFLHRHCECGGRMYRHYQEEFINNGDAGGSVICTDIRDCCAECGKVHAQSDRAWMPCPGIDDLFDAWDAQEINIETFDACLLKVLHKAGGVWKVS